MTDDQDQGGHAQDTSRRRHDGTARARRPWQWTAAGIILILLIEVVLPGVLGSDLLSQQGGRTINLQPDARIPIGTFVNLANQTTATSGTAQQIPLEKDFLNAEMTSDPGRYIGPYVRSSEFQFTSHVGGDFIFNSSFNFTSRQIMSGSSTFWVRWPVDPFQYDSVCLQVAGYFTSGDNGGVPYTLCEGAIQPDGTAAQAFYGFANTPPYYSGILTAQSFADLGAGVAIDSSGIYMKFWSGLLPDRTYNFTFMGHVLPGTSPSVWSSIEDFQVANTTRYVWGNPLTKARQVEDLALYPAFAFNFISGIGDGGLTAFQVPFDDTNSTFLNGHPVVQYEGVTNTTTYLSIYVPYTGATDVNWRISVHAVMHATLCANPSVDFWVNGTNGFLLTSTPRSYQEMNCGLDNLTNGDRVSVRIDLYANKPVTILGYIPGDQMPFDPNSIPTICGCMPTDATGAWALFDHMAIEGTDGSSNPVVWNQTLLSKLMYRFMPIFASVQWTTGRWATVTPGLFFTTYNFGWGKAYLFPGQVVLHTFLQNGTQLFYDSRAALAGSFGGSMQAAQQCMNAARQGGTAAITTGSNAMPDWLVDFVCVVESTAGNIIGTIVSAFQQVWALLQSLGQWIYTALVGLFTAIANVITGFVEIATQVAYSLLAAFPFVIILFAAGKGLPDVVDARRRYRRTVRRNLKRGRKLRRVGGKVRAAPGRALTKEREASLRYHESRTERIEARRRRMEARRRSGR